MKLLQLYFSFKGRLSLKDFWLYWNIPSYLVGVLAYYLLLNVFYYPKLWLGIGLLFTWLFLAISVKRLHDRDLSGWFLLLHLIPILGSIILFIPIYLTPGTERENRFDPSYKVRHPEEFQSKYHPLIKIASVLVIFQALCFLTNKSILGVVYPDGPYFGHVINAETGEPIAGAAIAGVWEFGHIIPVQIMWSFADANDTVTDNKGNFYIKRIWAFTPWILTARIKGSSHKRVRKNSLTN